MPKTNFSFPTMQELREEWGRNIVSRRHAAGWSQRVLARILDVDNALISRWELGKATPDDENKARIAGAFGLFVDEIFPWPPIRPPMPAPRAPRAIPTDGRRKGVKPTGGTGPSARRAA